MKPTLRARLTNRPLLMTASAARALMMPDEPVVEQKPKGAFGFLKQALAPAQTEAETAARIMACPLWLGDPDMVGDFGWVLKDGVAVITIDTPILSEAVATEWYFCHGYDTLLGALREADAHPSVNAILLRMDSPGGVVSSGLYTIASYLQARRAEAKAKPLWASCEMACSAAYWIACQADHVTAPQAGLIGSIGAVMVHSDVSGMYERLGIEITSIEFGEFKTAGAPWRGLKEAEREDLQAQINDIGEAFLSAVAAGRGGAFTAEAARQTQARTFLADSRDPERSARALGLIDEILSDEDAFARLASGDTHSPADGAKSANVTAQTATTQATTMPKHVRASVAALAASETDDETFKEKVRKLLDEDEPATEDEEDETSAEGDEDEAAAEGDEDEPAAEGDEDESYAEGDEDEPAAEDEDKPKGKKALSGTARIRAILDLKEAKGRDALAKTLAFDTRLSVKAARERLASAPKASSLGGKMAGKDPKISGDGGTPPKGAAAVADRALRNAGLVK